MDRVRTLALYDQEMRQNPPEEPGTYIDRSDGIVRLVGERSWIAFSRLASRDAAEAVERETSRFRKAGVELEWKLFDHDGPPEMGRLLAAAGFRPDLPETLMALDLGGPIVPFSAAAGISIDRISDALGVRDAVRVSHRAFAPEEGWNEEEYLGRIADPSMVILGARGEGHLSRWADSSCRTPVPSRASGEEERSPRFEEEESTAPWSTPARRSLERGVTGS